MNASDADAPSVSDSPRRLVLTGVAVLAALFHLYAAGVRPFTALVFRPVHLTLFGTLGLLGIGTLGSGVAGGISRGAAEGVWGRVRTLASALLVVALVASSGYLVLEHADLARRAGVARPLDLVAGAVSLLVVLELSRRAVGWGLLAVAVLALAYALLGPWMPGLLAHRGYGFGRLIEHLYLTTEGIWGIPLGVSADFVYLFVLFGAVLDAAGGGELFMGLAERVAGRTRGGPAKTSAVASGLMGSLSGSAVANVVTTGTFTIPVMRRAGFSPRFAAAVEAAASTGGQMVPPIMGAGAFIMATWTSIPYGRVAVAAAVPAVLYYLALFLEIHFRAGRIGLAPSRAGGSETLPVLPRLHLLLPLGVIVVWLALGRSPMRAAFWGVAAAVAVSFVRTATRPDASAARRALERAARGTVQVAAACAAAGVVVGVASLTGIGLRMSEVIVAVSGGHLPVALALTAAGSIVLGMGLPTTAAYVVLAALGAPALVELGVPLLASHLFIFYFGCISNVTPPVCLAAFAAAGLTGSPPMRTGLTAMSLAAAGFLVPFAFVYGEGLLLQGAPGLVLWTTLTASAGVAALAAAVIGFARRRLAAWERALLGAASVALIFPGGWTDAAGLVVLAAAFARGATGGPAEEPGERGEESRRGVR